jgi:putative transposase
LTVLHSERFVDQAPAQVYAALLDHSQEYLCSIRTMYRILDANQEVRERRRQRRHPQHVKPVLVARRPNQVWTWDITKLRGAQKGQLLYLYVVLDLYSRYVVGWTVAERESAVLAERLISASCLKQGVQRQQLTVHADRGSAMTSGQVLELYGRLGITPSFNRPRVSNDNAYSESHFKTLKYRPEFPDRFGGLEHARTFCGAFFRWYNEEHHHSGLALLTPSDVHHGRVEAVLENRQRVMDLAHSAHPERFVRGRPSVASPPDEVWINQPGGELVVEGTTQ